MGRVERLATKETEVVVVRYNTAAGQSIPNNSVTVLNYDNKVYDPDSLVTTGSGWTLTAKLGGYYRVSAVALFTSSSSWPEAALGRLDLYKGGAQFSVLDRQDHYSSASMVFMMLVGTDMVYLARGETMDIRVYQNTGSPLALHNLSVYNYVTIWKG
jgi:hypothetical protein